MTALPARCLALELPDGRLMDLRDPVVIGRDPGCQVVLSSPEVSRRHVVIEAGTDGLVLTDNSANGTYVGEQLVRQSSIPLADAAALRIGTIRISTRRIRTDEPRPDHRHWGPTPPWARVR